ncbi:MAG: hypothetical protein HC904_12135 [Blastochloris sp.]|nr:hypothetical protein [Blastochloris sp.]
MKCLRITCFILSALSLLAPLLNAAGVWDDGYRPYQDVAPEYLEIRVLRVDQQRGGALNGSNSRVNIQAEVLQVFRSGSGLRPGNTINLSYIRKSEAGTGSLEPSIPKEGATVPAFLRKKGIVMNLRPCITASSPSPLINCWL